LLRDLSYRSGRELPNACETRYVFVSDARQISSRIPLARAA
jgi:hypothetical protein